MTKSRSSSGRSITNGRTGNPRQTPAAAAAGRHGSDRGRGRHQERGRVPGAGSVREEVRRDVYPVTTAAMAVTQRPLDARANSSLSEAAAWHDIPSHYLTAAKDQTIEPEKQRYFAKRAKAHAVEDNSSHAVMVSHPAAVTRLIEEADHENR
ncbi:alpha/beta fold hydrolase [Streptomyces sp. NPDC093586]|uniref:alpha/beta fold hydrolase n=1 Tax=Streptomyces sp. NPDC093586 TaxID=3366042 RepID=UPI0037F46706